MESLTYSAWGTGFPSVNRTRNSTIVTEDGSWAEEICADGSRPEYFSPCEIRLAESVPRSQKVAQRSLPAAPAPTSAVEANLDAHTLKEARIVSIGRVGTKLYFKNGIEPDVSAN